MDDSYLMHVGTPHEGNIPHSGRHPWGSGEHAYQRLGGDIISTVNHLRAKGMSESDIAVGLGITRYDPKLDKKVGDVKRLRALKQIAVMEERSAKRARALELIEKRSDENGNYNVSAVARELGMTESSLRSLTNDAIHEHKQVLQKTIDQLDQQMKTKRFLDVGKGAEADLMINKNILDTALVAMEEKGYHTYTIRIPQMGTGYMTELKVLAHPEDSYGDVYKYRDEIKPINERVLSPDGTSVTRLNIEGFSTVNKKRVQIRYAEDGGADKDGVIELRRGVDDISLGKAHYAQCRIAVDANEDGKPDHYLKGMAVYSRDDMPQGVDIIFNTNKHKDKPFDEVVKPMKVNKETGEIDMDNPFGATIKPSSELKMTQKEYIDSKTGEKKLSAINIVNEEGDWNNWSKTLSSQFLSKQTEQLAKQQLDLSVKETKDQYDEIMKLTNATIKRELLIEFADNCDSAAEHLKASSLPGQGSHVILPLTKGIKETEIYAPNYENGTQVVLIRYPHAGRFEIPTLIVNNNSRIAKDIIGPHPVDAVGIHKSVADRLSGADFDGDSVMVIPIRDSQGRLKNDIKTANPLAGLANFDPKEAYPGYKGMKVISESDKQKKMGEVSNLITDMQISGGVTEDELVRAVKHSMVIIDAEKHELNYKQSYIDNDIAGLKAKYQVGLNGKVGGASTLISRAKSEERVPLRKQWYASGNTINPETGEKIQRENVRYSTWIDKETGEVKGRSTKSTKMAETSDASTLLSGPDRQGTRMERIYRDYANEMKRMANQARKQYLAEEKNELYKNASAAKTYEAEVKSLDYKLLMAKKNAPLERQAQNMAGVYVASKKIDHPDYTKDDLKKWRSQALASARARFGAEKRSFNITEREYEAIQAGAIGKTNLRQIIQYCDKDDLKQLAMPRQSKRLSPTKIARIKAMANSKYSDYSQSDIASALGVSVSTVNEVINGTY